MILKWKRNKRAFFFFFSIPISFNSGQLFNLRIEGFFNVLPDIPGKASINHSCI